MAALGRAMTMILSVLMDSATDIGLTGVLRAAWAAAILPLVTVSLPFSFLVPLRGALLGFALRGKNMQSSYLKFSLPQRFFSHFYMLGVLWTTLLLVATWAYAYNMTFLAPEPSIFSNTANHLIGDPFSLHSTGSTSFKQTCSVWNSVFLLLLMEIHVLRRLYEAIYVFNYSPSARMHIFGYLVGILYYLAAPLSLCSNFALSIYKFSASQVSELLVRGILQMPASEINFWGITNPLLKLQLHQWIGGALLLWGWIHQLRCHAILGSLRKHPEQSHEYVIPHGDWFEIVSCPHYLAEIVIYAGLVVASGGTDLTILLLFGFVVANLAFAATETHEWYRQKFDNYPRNRKADPPCHA
ncbi:hypothetical protein SAY87_014352 [Trapa incisa]|uniref:3-oxo-5-alpha-steroid 4-dehydrogenase C-terminal domain-containing protein n=1 Tax=Trapa incisa TaxID=236973 RepID=A0AAN7GNI9_9MYRT|nr:hypothetical protein SAY87_014352 [Trapa incisa]